MEEIMKNITEEALKSQEQADDQPAQPVEGQVQGANASLANVSKADAQRLAEACDALGVVYTIQPALTKDTKGEDIIVYNCTLLDVTDHQLDVIARKTNIMQWRDGITAVAQKVGNFAEDVGDFALNGAAAPAIISVANCASKVAPVAVKAGITVGVGVGTAAVHAGAEILTTAIQAGTRAYEDLSNDDSVKLCSQELKGLWSNVTGKLFGSTGSTKFSRC